MPAGGKTNIYRGQQGYIWGESGENWFIHRGVLFAGRKHAACNHFNPGSKNWFLPNLSFPAQASQLFRDKA